MWSNACAKRLVLTQALQFRTSILCQQRKTIGRLGEGYRCLLMELLQKEWTKFREDKLKQDSNRFFS